MGETTTSIIKFSHGLQSKYFVLMNYQRQTKLNKKEQTIYSSDVLNQSFYQLSIHPFNLCNFVNDVIGCLDQEILNVTCLLA